MIRECHGRVVGADGGGGAEGAEGAGGGASGGVARCGCWQSGHAPGCPLGRGWNTSRRSRDMCVVPRRQLRNVPYCSFRAVMPHELYVAINASLAAVMA